MEDNQNDIIQTLQQTVEKCIEGKKENINREPFEFVGFIDGSSLIKYRGI